MKYSTQKWKSGFIGIEVIIVASIMLVAGVVALKNAVSNTTGAVSKVEEGLGASEEATPTAAIGIDILENNLELGVTSTASQQLHWVYTPLSSVPDATPSKITWSVQSPENLSIDTNGRISTNGVAGHTMVSLSVTLGGRVMTDSITVNVVTKNLGDYSVLENGVSMVGTINLSYTKILMVDYYPLDATIFKATATVADTSIATATIDQQTGAVTVVPMSIGQTTMVLNINGINKSIPLNVTAVPVEKSVSSIDVWESNESTNWVTISAPKQLNLIINPNDAINKDALIVIKDAGVALASIDNTTRIITLIPVSSGDTQLIVIVDGKSKTVNVAVDIE